MDNPTARPPEEVAGDEVLDGADPHAGDEADWENDEPAAPIGTPEPSPFLFWKGLLLGLLLSTMMWCALAAVALGLYTALLD